MVTTGFKPSSTSPVHLCRLYDVGNSELGLYKSNKSNLHLCTSVWYTSIWIGGDCNGLLEMEINQLQTCRKLPSKSQVFQTNEAQLLFTLISRFCWGYHSDKLVSVSQPKRVKVCLSSSSPILFSILGCLWNLWHLAMARERRKEGGTTCLDLTTANGSYPLNPGTDVSPIRVIAGTSSL